MDAPPPPYAILDPQPRLSSSPATTQTPPQSRSEYDSLQDGVNSGSLYISGAPYFAMRPPPQPRPRKILPYCITILPHTISDELPMPNAGADMLSRDVTDQDWQAFLCHLLPHHAVDSSGEKGDGEQNPPLKNGMEGRELQEEAENRRHARLQNVNTEWNEGFFLPRGVSIILQTATPIGTSLSTRINKNSDLGPALYEAVKSSDPQMVQLLLSHGADPDWKPSCATPAIVEAVKRKDDAILQMLLERGPDLEARATGAETALYAAVSMGDVKPLKMLLLYGAQVNGAGPSGGEPTLCRAVSKGFIDIVKILLDTDVDLEKKPPGGATSLYRVADQGNVAVVQMLLDKGAKAECRAPGGSSAMYRAAGRGDINVTRLLLEYGAHVDSTPPGGHTALYTAVSSGDQNMVRLLLDHGANPNAKAGGRESAVSRASKMGQVELVRLLLEHTAAR